MFNDEQQSLKSQDLPSFKRPPLAEVYLSVQFVPIAKFDIPQLGACWSIFKNDFPNYQRHEPTARIVEREGLKIPSPADVPLEFQNLPLPRLWFIDKEGKELVQVQNDRFIRNWRKATSGDIYPRYNNHIRPRFAKDFERFKNFLITENVGNINIDQCEIAYINHIPAGEGWSDHSEMSKIFTIWNPQIENELNLPFEGAEFNARLKILGSNGVFLGRLHILLKPGFNRDGDPIFQLSLTARGKPLNQDTQSIMGFLDQGRAHIIRAFTAITTSNMHEIWGKET